MSQAVDPAAQAASAPGQPALFYSPQLDGLRAIAALLVFVHHAPAISGLTALRDLGWVGVDLFLSISAFLLTRLIALEFSSIGSFAIGRFFVRRILRIWPLYLGYATFICTVAAMMGQVTPQTAAAWWLSHISFTNNVMTAIKGYSPILFSAHLWTIALEEQAYLALPVVLAIILPKGVGRPAVLKAAFAVLGVLMLARTGLYLAQAPHPFVWVLPLRADSIVLGAVAALVLGTKSPPRPHILLLGAGLLFLTVGVFPDIGARSVYQIFGYTIIALACTGTVVATQGDLVLNRFLANRVFRYLGKISFGIYVYHLLCIAIATSLVRRLGGGGRARHRGVRPRPCADHWRSRRFIPPLRTTVPALQGAVRARRVAADLRRR